MIYCVEDDKNIQKIEVYTLTSMGFEARGLSSYEELVEALNEKIPELILLDIMLEGTDGIEILQKLKSDARYLDIPVIMATAKGEEYDKIEALDLGADDYLVKPISMLEMVSRVKAVLRRCERQEERELTTLHYADITVDFAGYRVLVDSSCFGKSEGESIEIDLTPKEYELLALFVKNPGRVFTREDLLSSIWQTEYYGNTRTVDVHIRTLRSKLGTAGSLIKTVRNFGYKLGQD